MIEKVTESPKLMHLGNLAVNLLFTLQPIITLRVVYTIGLPMEKTREWLVNSTFNRVITNEGKIFPSRE